MISSYWGFMIIVGGIESDPMQQRSLEILTTISMPSLGI